MKFDITEYCYIPWNKTRGIIIISNMKHIVIVRKLDRISIFRDNNGNILIVSLPFKGYDVI
jgi:hypothetical protein